MASLVFRAPSGVVGIQPTDFRSSNLKPVLAISISRAQLNPCVFQENIVLGISPQQSKRLSRIATSVSEEATTETEGGVFEVEDEASFEQYLRDAGDKLVVLDISTKTCGPCRIIYPKVVKMSKEYPNAVFLKIMGDLNSGTRALMRKWGVRAVPNFRFFRNGELIHSHSGASEDELRGHILVHYQEPAQV